VLHNCGFVIKHDIANRLNSKCPGRNTFTLAAALVVRNGNNKIIYKDILIALADAINGVLSMPCHE